MFKEMIQNFVVQQVSKKIGSSIGIDENLVNKVVDEGVGSMILGLAKNTSTEEGKKSLYSAVQKDHDGSILDNVTEIFADGKQSEGQGILKHILGTKQGAIENQISKDTGLDLGQVTKILTTIAPIVLGMLGKQSKSSGFGLDDLVGFVTEEKDQVVQKSQGLGIFGKILDQDGDGDFDVMDAFKMIT